MGALKVPRDASAKKCMLNPIPLCRWNHVGTVLPPSSCPLVSGYTHHPIPVSTTAASPLQHGSALETAALLEVLEGESYGEELERWKAAPPPAHTPSPAGKETAVRGRGKHPILNGQK